MIAEDSELFHQRHESAFVILRALGLISVFALFSRLRVLLATDFGIKSSARGQKYPGSWTTFCGI